MKGRGSEAGKLTLYTDQAIAYRIGHAPDPFSWTPWQYADDGRFDGRWDDPAGTYRTLYLGDRLLGCLLEALADFRPDLVAQADIYAIVDNDDSDGGYPTIAAGTLPRSWLGPRRAGSAVLNGEYVDVRDVDTLATLRRRFGALAAGIGLPDLDASAIKSSAPRALTQAISGWLNHQIRPAVSGVCFASRFGDALTMWAIFERPGEDLTGSAALAGAQIVDLETDSPTLAEAMRIHGLVWE